MKIDLAESDAAIMACYSVMRELRERLDEKSFLARVRSQARSGYRLACLTDEGRVRAVAGFRLSENLAWGPHLYVDDLVTDPRSRSRGYGASLLGWLEEFARAEGCGELHLDSGAHRTDAHRFYRREGLEVSGPHFRRVL